MTRRLRLLAVTAAAAVLVPGLTACGVNFDAQTDQVYIPAEGVNDRDGSVDVIHALVVSENDGSGTVVATLVNNDVTTPDALTGVEGAGDDTELTVEVRDDADAVIPPEGTLKLGETGHVTVSGEGVQAGRFVRLLFTFDNGEAAELDVPVLAATGDYAGLDVSGGEARGSDQPSDPTPSEEAGS